MKNLEITVFVRDKDGNLVDRYDFCGPNEDVLRAAVHAFKLAMEKYCKDYTAQCTPIRFIF